MIKPTFPGWNNNTEWVECVWCGAKALRVEIYFDTGSVEPTDDEKVTGGTSGDTGYVLEDSLVLYDGSWAGGDAEGWLTLYTVTGHDYLTGIWGSAGEALTGASTLVCELATQSNGDPHGIIKMDGVTLHRIEDCTQRDGKWYCHEHYHWYFHGKDRDKSNRDARIDERDRGQEWT